MPSWMIPTHNDPLGAVRGVLKNLWTAARLKRILLPLNGNADTTGPQVIVNPEQIHIFNPFTPLMPLNAAQLMPDMVNSGEPVAAVLRPCEMRTLDGMIKRQNLKTDNLMTISVDCLGTLPSDEFKLRTQRRGSPKGLAQDALHSARQGGIVPYRYRAACQICVSPEATDADINIGVLGLPVRQYLLLQIPDANLARLLQHENAIPIKPQLLSGHQRVVARLAERGRETREQIFTGLASVLPSNLDTLAEPLHGCGDCRTCLDTCPLSTSDFPKKNISGEYIRDDVMEWLAACSECGVCEQDCPKHLPLTIIFGHLRDQFAALH